MSGLRVGAGRTASVDEVIDVLRSLTGRSLRVERDERRVRRVDRPVLEADPSRLLRQFPGFEPTPLRDALEGAIDAST